jgi:beta-glucosidase
MRPGTILRVSLLRRVRGSTFPFGYGLSYTTFTLDGLSVRGHAATGKYKVSVRVRNTGNRRGAEVVQLYVGFPDSIDGPPNQLKGFAKVTVDPGKARRVKMKLDPSSFAHWSTTENAWVVEPGTYALRVGTSSRNLVLEREVAIQPR